MKETGHVVAVRDVSFEVRQGEIFVIMGLSGSGKSTLVRMINRLIEPTRGTVCIDGADLTRMNRADLIQLRRRSIAMVFQSFALMPHLTNLENAAFGLAVAGVKEPDRSARAQRALETVGLAGFERSHPYELSGGMQQRVGLARALAVEPEIMLMDEAFSALDPLIRTEMQNELLSIQRARDLTVIFVSHDLDEALHVGDRLAIMHDGVAVQIGTPRELVTTPANDYVRSFFGQVDVSKILTAEDVAEAPAATVQVDRKSGRAVSRPAQDSSDLVYVCDRDGAYRGIADRAALETATRNSRPINEETLVDGIDTVTANEKLAEILDTVAGAPCPVPVVDSGGRLQGVISRAGLLHALQREDAE